MDKHVLFIQGGGNGGYEEDEKLVASLRTFLGSGYEVHYPRLISDEALPDFGWLEQITKELNLLTDRLFWSATLWAPQCC